MICRAGFQSGAREAVKQTNVDLLTFEELQTIFLDRWRISICKHFMPFADRLFPYWDYPGKWPRIKWTPWHVQKQQLLTEAYLPLVNLGPMFELRGRQWVEKSKAQTARAARKVPVDSSLYSVSNT